jgi:predicted nucleic acid-binding protein
VNNKVFIDTGAWYAVADKADQFHSVAVKHLQYLFSNRSSLITTNLIIHETTMLMSRKLSKKSAIQFLDTIYNDESVTVLQNNEILEGRAYKIFKKFSDQDFSITDCVSFIVSKDLLVKRVFSFDNHFKVMKFEMEPQI